MTRILLAEDDEIMRITIRDRLERCNWHVDTVSNGQLAADRLHKQQYSLVISDIRMPGIDGWELLKIVRTYFPGTRFIMMTAYGSVDDAAESLARGATDYILKPFDMDDLVARVICILATETLPQKTAGMQQISAEKQR